MFTPCPTERSRVVAERVEAFVRDVIVPYERDPRAGAHGPSAELVAEMRAKARDAGLMTPHILPDGSHMTQLETAAVLKRSGLSPLGPVPPSVTGFSVKSFQVFTGEVCQVRHTLTASVMAPSHVNFELSYFCVGSNSGAMPAMRVKVPKVSPSRGALGGRCADVAHAHRCRRGQAREARLAHAGGS